MNESPHLDRLQDDDTLEAGGVEVVDLRSRARRLYDVLQRLQGDAPVWISRSPRVEIQDAIAAAGEEPPSERVITAARADLERKGLLRTQRNGADWMYVLQSASPAGRPYVIRAVEEIRAAREAIRTARVHSAATTPRFETSGGTVPDRTRDTPSSSVVVPPPPLPAATTPPAATSRGAATSSPEGIGAWPTDRHAAIAYRLRRLGIEARDRSLIDDLASAPQRVLDGFDLPGARRCAGVWERVEGYQARPPEYARKCLDTVLDVLLREPEPAPTPPAGATPTASSSAPRRDHRIIRRVVRAAVRIGAALRVLRGARP